MPNIIPSVWAGSQFLKYCEKLSRSQNRSIFFPEAFDFLMRDYLQVSNLELRIKNLEDEVDELKIEISNMKDEEINHLREIQKLQAQSPIAIQANPQMQQNFMPPPPSKLSPNAKPMIKEMNEAFLGGKLKPSEIGMKFKEPIKLKKNHAKTPAITEINPKGKK